jgi:hypothetical protein
VYTDVTKFRAWIAGYIGVISWTLLTNYYRLLSLLLNKAYWSVGSWSYLLNAMKLLKNHLSKRRVKL